MTYTINGKEWTEFDINLRCAELLGFKVSKEQYMNYGDRDENVVLIGSARDSYGVNYTRNPADTDAIIDKCWGELMSSKDERGCGTWTHWDHVKWQRLMNEHNCTKLVAACICYIEMQEEI
jgi:hypothetical protein